MLAGAFSKGIALTTQFISAAADLAAESVKLAADFETTVNGLAVFSGSLASARRELLAIDKIAAETTGLRLQSAEEGYQRLRALNFEAGLTQKLVKGIANQKLLSGSDEGAVDRVIVNLTQIRASAKDGARDIKEMIKAIPSLSGVFQDVFKTSSTSELRKILQQNPKDFFDRFATGLANAKQAQGGLNDSIGKFYDSLTLAGRATGEPLLSPLNDDVKDLTS